MTRQKLHNIKLNRWAESCVVFSKSIQGGSLTKCFVSSQSKLIVGSVQIKMTT